MVFSQSEAMRYQGLRANRIENIVSKYIVVPTFSPLPSFLLVGELAAVAVVVKSLVINTVLVLVLAMPNCIPLELLIITSATLGASMAALPVLQLVTLPKATSGSPEQHRKLSK